MAAMQNMNYFQTQLKAWLTELHTERECCPNRVIALLQRPLVFASWQLLSAIPMGQPRKTD